MTDLAGAVRKLAIRYVRLEMRTFRKTAVVTSEDPLEVQFPGDTAATPVPLQAVGFTPVDGQTVVVEKVGRDWVVAYAIEES